VRRVLIESKKRVGKGNLFDRLVEKRAAVIDCHPVVLLATVVLQPDLHLVASPFSLWQLGRDADNPRTAIWREGLAQLGQRFTEASSRRNYHLDRREFAEDGFEVR
jgi:hypothetical protein